MEWHLVLVAVVTGTVVHEVMEPGSAMYKLRRLEKAIKTGKIETPPLKGVNTRAKAYAISLVGVAVFSAIAYVVAQWLNPSVQASMIYAVVVSLLGTVLSTVQLDQYHVKIEKITQKQKR